MYALLLGNQLSLTEEVLLAFVLWVSCHEICHKRSYWICQGAVEEMRWEFLFFFCISAAFPSKPCGIFEVQHFNWNDDIPGWCQRNYFSTLTSAAAPASGRGQIRTHIRNIMNIMTHEKIMRKSMTKYDTFGSFRSRESDRFVSVFSFQGCALTGLEICRNMSKYVEICWYFQYPELLWTPLNSSELLWTPVNSSELLWTPVNSCEYVQIKNFLVSPCCGLVW